MDAVPPNRLSEETELYEACKVEWLRAYRDQFVVVKSREVLGFYKTFQEAYLAGVENYGMMTDFLVKRVVPKEPVFLVF